MRTWSRRCVSVPGATTTLSPTFYWSEAKLYPILPLGSVRVGSPWAALYHTLRPPGFEVSELCGCG